MSDSESSVCLLVTSNRGVGEQADLRGHNVKFGCCQISISLIGLQKSNAIKT